MLKQRLMDALIGAIAGFAIAAMITVFTYDKALRTTQAYSHEVALNAAAIAFRARVHSDSLQHQVDTLQHAKQKVVRVAVQDTISAAIANRALLQARSARDSNVVYRRENLALRQANRRLFIAVNLAQRAFILERVRSDSLAKALTIVNADLQGLNARVQQLHPRPPKLIRIATGLLKYGAVAFGGYECGRWHCI